MTDTRCAIVPADREAMARARARWDALSKPKGSLGLLEELVVKIAGAQGTDAVAVSRRVCIVFASDNGIVRERVSQSSEDLTAAVCRHIAAGCGNINIMAGASGCDVMLVDVGMKSCFMNYEQAGMVDLRVMDGTHNFLREPAMSEAEMEQAMRTGIKMAERIYGEGYTIASAGEMGIGNTTTSTAVIAALLGIEPETILGRGGGLDDAGLRRKKEVLEKGLARYGFSGREADDERKIHKTRFAREVLRCVGGLDIAAMAGFYLGCAAHRIPIVLDGLISAAAALVASFIEEHVTDYLLASHMGREKGSRAVLEYLGLSAILHGDLALGEGTGAVLLFPVLDVALAEYRQALTFEEMGFATDDDADDGIRVFTKQVQGGNGWVS